MVDADVITASEDASVHVLLGDPGREVVDVSVKKVLVHLGLTRGQIFLSLGVALAVAFIVAFIEAISAET